MKSLEDQILAAVARPSYQPLKPKALGRKLGYSGQGYDLFKTALRNLLQQGRLEVGKGNLVRPVSAAGTIVGIYRQASGGFGFVRPHPVEGRAGPDLYIAQGSARDASTGDEVLVRKIKSRSNRGPAGEILRVLERATNSFVGTYFVRDGQGLVRVDGTVFSHSIYVGDPGAKGARPDDKVVFEMIRFPSPEDRGEGVITEILGPRGQPGVDTLSVIRALGLPDVFPDDALVEARQVAAAFREDDLEGRQDFTDWLTITIDPPDAHDFDDAVSLTIDPRSKHWSLGVHIADVGYFAAPGGALDREARRRATSVYLPQRVLPMFPEIISNSLASLQQGKTRFVKSVLLDLTPAGQRAHIRFANAAIRVKQRFSYEQVSALFEAHDRGAATDVAPEIMDLLLRMRTLGMLLTKRRRKRGALQLNMPEIELEYDDQGRVTGGHFRKHDISHQIIEEFMLTANEAVANYLDHAGVTFLRRVHPAPEPNKLAAFAGFARILGYKIKDETDRFALQQILDQSAGKPDAHAVHYALLRSLKQAVYSPADEGHYALASENYCHFTSPIRRYPDLVAHRLLEQMLRRGRAGSAFDELAALGEHCSRMERRAELAERELIKLKLLTHMSQRLGTDLNAVITGVADYGFYAQAEDLPVEGLVHVSTLPDDYYYFDEPSHSLIGQRAKRRYRLGDRVAVTVVRVDVQRRQLDFRVRKK